MRDCYLCDSAQLRICSVASPRRIALIIGIADFVIVGEHRGERKLVFRMVHERDNRLINVKVEATLLVRSDRDGQVSKDSTNLFSIVFGVVVDDAITWDAAGVAVLPRAASGARFNSRYSPVPFADLSLRVQRAIS